MASRAGSNVFRLHNIIDVQDPLYGVRGDGVVDDTAALIAAIANSPSGSTLLITGTPLVSSKITVNRRVRLYFPGAFGINAATRPGNYLIKKSTLNDYALEFTAEGSGCYGGGVVAQEGNGSDNIRLAANSVAMEYVYSENAGRYGFFHDGSGNANHLTLTGCRSYGNTSHGFYLTGDNANASTYLNCFAQSNGGDGIFSERTGSAVCPAWNSFNGCGADSNTGYGIRLKGGINNKIDGGDCEANTAGDIFIDATEQYAVLIDPNNASVITDNGFYTRRLDRFRRKRGTFHAALRGAGGATLTATAVTIAGTTATITSAAHGMANGDTVFHGAFSNGNLNGAFPISNVTANTYDITYRTDVSATAPVSQTGLAVAVQRCGTLTVARGDYVIEDGECQVWGTITTSAVTNISGAVQIVLPFDCLVVDANTWTGIDVSYYDGITHGGRLSALLNHNNANRVAALYENIGTEPAAPSQLQGTGLAAATTVIFKGRYPVATDH